MIKFPDNTIKFNPLPGEAWMARKSRPTKRKMAIAGVDRDVTERARTEEALHEREEMFQATFDQAAVGITLLSLKLGFLGVNDRFCEILGYSHEELASMGLRDVMPPESLTETLDFRRRLAAGEIPGRELREKELVRKDGSRVWVAIATSLVRGKSGEPRYFISTVHDISEAKRATAALRESEERFRRTFELAGSGVAHIGMDRRFTRVNRRLCEMLGYSEDELLRLTGRQISHPEDLDVINAQRPSLYAGEIDAVRVEKRYLRKDGSVVWVAFAMVVERDAAGEPQYEIAFFDDITARKQAEAALSASEALYRQTFELATAGIAHVDLTGRFMKVNRSLCEILGYSEKELIGRSVKEVSHPEDRDLTDAQRARLHEGGLDSVRFEKRYLKNGGSIVWVDLAVALARDAHGHPQYEVALFDDITARKAAEAALRGAHEELKRSNAELEQFAYVASHDLQEPLRMVSSYTQLLMRRYGDKLDGDARELPAFIVDGATRMKQLIEDLLAYSRVGTRDKKFKPVDAGSSLKRALTNLRAAIQDSGATVTQEALPTIPCDE